MFISLRYLGYKISHPRAEKIAREVDNDASGHISFQALKLSTQP